MELTEEDSGRWITITRKIHSNEQLRRYLIKYAPAHAYASVNEFLSFHNIDHPTYQFIKNPIRSHLWIEFDFDQSSPPECKKGCLEAIRLLPEGRVKVPKEPSRIVCSGKGFYLYYEDRFYTDEEKELVIKYLLEKNIPIDSRYSKNHKLISTMIDSKRISRLENSVRPSGEICQPLTMQELIDYPIQREPQMPEAMTRIISRNSEVEPPIVDKEPTSTYQYFLLNRVLGKKCFIPIIKLKKGSRINDVYKLGLVYQFDDSEHSWFISPKIVSRERLLKILRAFKSLNYNEFRRRNILLFPTSPQLGTKKPKPVFIKKQGIELPGVYSSRHLSFLKDSVTQPLVHSPIRQYLIRGETNG